MGIAIVSFLCALICYGIQAEVDIEARFKMLEAALQKDNLRIIRLEELVTQQQEMLTDQAVTIDEQQNQLHMQIDKINEQADIIRNQNEVLSAQSATIQLLKSDIKKYTTQHHETAYHDTHRSESLIKTESRPGSGFGTAHQEKRDTQGHNTFVSTGNNDFRARIVRAAVEMVAFTAIMVTDQNNIGLNQNIIFDRVVLNDGGAYHAQHGIFIAPVSGYYMFSTSVLHPQTNQQFRVGLVLNGNLIAIAFGTDNIWSQGSQTVVLKITSGDEVWIKNLDFEHESLTGNGYSTFTGVLLLQL